VSRSAWWRRAGIQVASGQAEEVPVELVVELPERPSAAIETIAYFCVAELLTNVGKYSGAGRATLEVVHVSGLLRVRVRGDGAGGARLEARGGLAGLAERVRTMDGRLQALCSVQCAKVRHRTAALLPWQAS
jgi:signal transduction histidine kinase